jgi:hypothetical protein
MLLFSCLIFLLIIPFASKATVYCVPDTCWTGAGGCQQSVNPTLCVYPCRLEGHFNYTTMECVQTAPPTTEISVTNKPIPLCLQPGYCKRLDGTCVPSVFGTPCEECNFNGFITNTGVCDCYSTTYEEFCLTNTGGSVQTVQVNMYNSYCLPWRDKRLGFFADPPAQGRYGDRNALKTPQSCWSELYGPEPGVLKDGIRLLTCNTIVSNVNSSLPKITCGGNGYWYSYPEYFCSCFDNWQGVEIVTPEATGITCGQCRGWWGPRVGIEPVSPTPYCSVIYTPDVVTGVYKECGGHGQYVQGVGCICDFSLDTGFWTLRNITSTFTTLNGSGNYFDENITVATCAECSFGFVGTLCNIFNASITHSPTEIQNTSSPTSLPTLAPTSTCYGCLDSFYVENKIYSIIEYVDYNLTDLGECYNTSNITYLSIAPGVYNVTFPTNQTYNDLQRFGAVLSRMMSANNWDFYGLSLDNTYIYEFINVAFTQIDYVNSGLGIKCW